MVRDVGKRYDQMDTYNFEVEDWQAYFVTASEILVHNGGYSEVPVTKLEHPLGYTGSGTPSGPTPSLNATGPGPYVFDKASNIILKPDYNRKVTIGLTNNINGGYYYQTRLRPLGFRITGIPSDAFNNGANQGAILQLAKVVTAFFTPWRTPRPHINPPSYNYVPGSGYRNYRSEVSAVRYQYYKNSWGGTETVEYYRYSR